MKLPARFKKVERMARRAIGRDWEAYPKASRPPAPTRELTLEIRSTYCYNVPVELIEKQARVFEHLRVPLEQVEFGNAGASETTLHRQHGETIERLIAASRADLLIFFDVDCIPLNQDVIKYCYLPVMMAGGLVGPAQRANHIDRFIYAAPAAIGFARTLYATVGSPRLTPSKRFDVCGALTDACEKRQIPVVKLPPETSQASKWPLYDDRFEHYGHGTTYTGGIYHAFEVRLGTTREMFLRKCDEVLAAARPELELGPMRTVIPD